MNPSRQCNSAILAIITSVSSSYIQTAADGAEGPFQYKFWYGTPVPRASFNATAYHSNSSRKRPTLRSCSGDDSNRR